jgi:hypothetical protein
MDQPWIDQYTPIETRSSQVFRLTAKSQSEVDRFNSFQTFRAFSGHPAEAGCPEVAQAPPGENGV